MSIEDMTLRELSDRAANNAKADRADPNDAERARLAKETATRIGQLAKPAVHRPAIHRPVPAHRPGAWSPPAPVRVWEAGQ